MAWQVYALSNAPTALAMVGIAMTLPTIACLLLGGVVSDRFDRRRVILATDVVRGVAVGLIARARPGRRAAALAHRGAGGALRGGHRLLRARVRRAGAGAAAGRGARAGQLARPVRAAAGAAPRRAGARRRARGRPRRGLGVRARRGLVHGLRRPRSCACGRPRAGTGSVSAGSLGADLRTGFDYVRRHVWLWGTFAAAAIAYLCVHGPHRGAAAVRREEQPARQRRRPRPGARRRRHRLGGLRGG